MPKSIRSEIDEPNMQLERGIMGYNPLPSHVLPFGLHTAKVGDGAIFICPHLGPFEAISVKPRHSDTNMPYASHSRVPKICFHREVTNMNLQLVRRQPDLPLHAQSQRMATVKLS